MLCIKGESKVLGERGVAWGVAQPATSALRAKEGQPALAPVDCSLRCQCTASPATRLSPRRVVQQLHIHRPRGQLHSAGREQPGALGGRSHDANFRRGGLTSRPGERC